MQESAGQHRRQGASQSIVETSIETVVKFGSNVNATARIHCEEDWLATLQPRGACAVAPQKKAANQETYDRRHNIVVDGGWNGEPRDGGEGRPEPAQGMFLPQDVMRLGDRPDHSDQEVQPISLVPGRHGTINFQAINGLSLLALRGGGRGEQADPRDALVPRILGGGVRAWLESDDECAEWEEAEVQRRVTERGLSAPAAGPHLPPPFITGEAEGRKVVICSGCQCSVHLERGEWFQCSCKRALCKQCIRAGCPCGADPTPPQ